MHPIKINKNRRKVIELKEAESMENEDLKTELGTAQWLKQLPLSRKARVQILGTHVPRISTQEVETGQGPRGSWLAKVAPGTSHRFCGKPYFNKYKLGWASEMAQGQRHLPLSTFPGTHAVEREK